jgi:small-conductance mechanosensitive channel
MSEEAKELLERKLLTVGGSTITLGSLLLGSTILLVALLLSSALSFSARRLLRARGATQGAQFAVAKIIRYVVVTIGVLAGVNAAGFQLGALFAASAVLAVGIGFGLQNVAQNFICGLILLVEQPVRHGDFVRVGETLGTVDDIGLRATHIITQDEVTIIVPNSALVTGQVINHSRPTTNLRIRVGVGVAYGSDTEQVRQVLLAVARAHSDVLSTPAPEVRFEDFGDSALAFSLLCWIAHARNDLDVASALRFAIDRAFRDAKIDIPFPQREVNLRLQA